MSGYLAAVITGELFLATSSNSVEPPNTDNPARAEDLRKFAPTKEPVAPFDISRLFRSSGAVDGDEIGRLAHMMKEEKVERRRLVAAPTRF